MEDYIKHEAYCNAHDEPTEFRSIYDEDKETIVLQLKPSNQHSSRGILAVVLEAAKPNIWPNSGQYYQFGIDKGRYAQYLQKGPYIISNGNFISTDRHENPDRESIRPLQLFDRAREGSFLATLV